MSLPGLKLASNGEGCEIKELRSEETTPHSTRISAHVSFVMEKLKLVRYRRRIVIIEQNVLLGVIPLGV
jgi:hypothetical protein